MFASAKLIGSRGKRAFSFCRVVLLVVGLTALCISCGGPEIGDGQLVVRLVAPIEGRAMSLFPTLRAEVTRTDFKTRWVFEVDSDSLFGSPLSSGKVSANEGDVRWRVTEELEVAALYYWRIGESIGTRIHWQQPVSFEGGPPLHLFPSPFCCENAKKYKTVLLKGMVPPAHLKIFNRHSLLVYETGRITSSQFAWPLVDQAGDSIPNGRFRFEVTDKTGNRTLSLRISR